MLQKGTMNLCLFSHLDKVLIANSLCVDINETEFVALNISRSYNLSCNCL